MIGMKALFAMLAAALGGPTISPARPGYMAKRRPTGAALRNPNDPNQAAAILFAAGKRDRKAEKLQLNANRSFMGNCAHYDAFLTLDDMSGFIKPLGLNPFYVAK